MNSILLKNFHLLTYLHFNLRFCFLFKIFFIQLWLGHDSWYFFLFSSWFSYYVVKVIHGGKTLKELIQLNHLNMIVKMNMIMTLLLIVMLIFTSLHQSQIVEVFSFYYKLFLRSWNNYTHFLLSYYVYFSFNFVVFLLMFPCAFFFSFFLSTDTQILNL